MDRATNHSQAQGGVPSQAPARPQSGSTVLRRHPK